MPATMEKKKKIVIDLKEIADEIGNYDPKLEKEINDIIKSIEMGKKIAKKTLGNIIGEVNGIIREVRSTDEKLAGELKKLVAEISGLKKKGGLIEPGMRVTCVNPVQGILKGRIYTVGEIVRPNFGIILEDDGTAVGIFALNRFVIDNNEY